MTRTENMAARGPGRLNRDGDSRRLSQTVDAQRRLNARQANSLRTNPDPHGPSDPRHAYLTQSHASDAYRRIIPTSRGADMPGVRS
jgi:hypothetical protein